MHETVVQRLSTFYRRSKWIIFLLILFPTLLTSAIGISVLSLYSGAKDIIFGVLIIVLASTIITGSVLSFFLTRKVSLLAKKQSAFLANVSHELRSPLAAIKLHSQTLASGRCNDSIELCVGHILKSTDKLERLVEQILHWKQIVGKRDKLNLKLIDANVPMSMAWENYEASHEKIIGTVISELMDSPPKIMGDENFLERAIYNLIDNAYKYSNDEDRKIVMSTNLVSKGKTKTLEYTIKDNGIGIHENDIDNIFEEFQRGKYELKGVAGLGLGLGIVRSIALSHNGRIIVKSEFGKGSTFILSIPVYN